MLEFLNKTDTQLFLFLNGHNSTFVDILMWNISKIAIWIPLYVVILFFVFRRLKVRGLITLLILILIIVASDQGSVHLFKNVFHRLRPCHQPELAGLVHLVNGKCGGQYGFISSHAANTFAFASFISLFFRRKVFSVLILLWAGIVSYSRIYLGVHYPFDIVGGAAFGILLGYLFFILHQYIFRKYFPKKSPVKGFLFRRSI